MILSLSIPTTFPTVTVFIFCIFKHWQERWQGEGKEREERKKVKKINFFNELNNQFVAEWKKDKIKEVLISSSDSI